MLLYCFAICHSGEREDQRKALTTSVRQYIRQQRTAGNKGLFLLDLEKPFDYWSLSPERRTQVFDDGVHMTEYGYELLGDLVYKGLLKAMGYEGAEKSRPAKKATKGNNKNGRKPVGL